MHTDKTYVRVWTRSGSRFTHCVHVLATGLPQKATVEFRPYSNTTVFVRDICGDNIKRDHK